MTPKGCHPGLDPAIHGGTPRWMPGQPGMTEHHMTIAIVSAMHEELAAVLALMPDERKRWWRRARILARPPAWDMR
jgi:hypothetical protein